MNSSSKFTILNIGTNSNNGLKEICETLNILEIYADNAENALETLMDTKVNLIAIDKSCNYFAMIKLLEMISSDVENKGTPIIIIADDSYDESFSKDLAEFNILAIYTYTNWQNQVTNLLSFIKAQTQNSLALRCELNESEVRNIVDPLTGALNRYGAEDSYINLTSRYAAYNETFSLIMMDIDHFKRVNDSHGHDVGDEVLIELSALIQHSIRSNDKLIRFGGEEFFILLSNADIDIAVEI
ncbi:MAG: diguanylate cyclase, partial [Campylobacterota bacterium]|nr:diguanylate cyclase [Campylobacterota bacterium]